MNHQHRRPPSALGIQTEVYNTNPNGNSFYNSGQQGYYPYEGGGPPSFGSQNSDPMYPTYSPANSVASAQSYNDSPYGAAPRYSQNGGYSDPAMMGASYPDPALLRSTTSRPSSPRASYVQAGLPPQPRPLGGANRSPYGSTYDLRGNSGDAWDTHSVNSHQSYNSIINTEVPPPQQQPLLQQMPPPPPPPAASSMYPSPYGPSAGGNAYLAPPPPEAAYGLPYDPYAAVPVPVPNPGGYGMPYPPANLPPPSPYPPAYASPNYPAGMPRAAASPSPGLPPVPLSRQGSFHSPGSTIQGINGGSLPRARPEYSSSMYSLPLPADGRTGTSPYPSPSAAALSSTSSSSSSSAVRWAEPSSSSTSPLPRQPVTTPASMREPSPVDADLEEALKRSMEDANVYRHQQDDSYRALEAANDAALRRALEESVREQRQPVARTAIEQADEEALHRALRESAQESTNRVQSALEQADEEALRQAIQRSLEESSPPARIQSMVLASQEAARTERQTAASYANRPLPKVPSAGNRTAMGTALAGRTLVPMRVPSEPNLGV